MSGLLEINALCSGYKQSQVIHDLELKIQPKEIVAIMGRNGMGKTTTLRTIMGILRKRTGEITFAGQNLMAMPLYKVARTGIGFVPEERGIFATLSVEENLMLPPVVAPGGMSLDEIYDLFPNLLERRNSPGTKLSGGEQQMLAMARILRTGVKCILLDEPTEGLAPVIIQRIGEVLVKLKARGMTVVLVEQNFRFASKIADRFYLMDHGQMTAEFPVSQLADKMELLNQELGV